MIVHGWDLNQIKYMTLLVWIPVLRSSLCTPNYKNDVMSAVWRYNISHYGAQTGNFHVHFIEIRLKNHFNYLKTCYQFILDMRLACIIWDSFPGFNSICNGVLFNLNLVNPFLHTDTFWCLCIKLILRTFRQK